MTSMVKNEDVYWETMGLGNLPSRSFYKILNGATYTEITEVNDGWVRVCIDDKKGRKLSNRAKRNNERKMLKNEQIQNQPRE